MSIDVTTATGRVRVMIGDVDETDLFLADDMIAVYLSGGPLEQASEYLAAAECAMAIAAKVARRPLGLSEGGAQVNWGVMSKRYSDLADELKKKHAAQLETADGYFDWAEQAVDPFSARERLRNEFLREAL